MKNLHVKDLDVNPRITEKALRGGLHYSSEILKSNSAEIQAKLGVNETDAKFLIQAAASSHCPTVTNASEMDVKSIQGIAWGDRLLDEKFSNGVPVHGITEICGESGAGKSQLALQLAIQAQLPLGKGGMGKAVAFICTESPFPTNRFSQISSRRSISTFNGKPVTDNLFIHHLPDMDQLCDCVQYQLENFIHSKNIGTVIIDSVAAVIRADDSALFEKSKAVSKLGFMLHQISHKYKVAVIAINQVTAKFNRDSYGLVGDVVPALGLAWANYLTTRIMVNKTQFFSEDLPAEDRVNRIRNMEVIFCPWMDRISVPYVISEEGVNGVVAENLLFSRN